MLKHVVDARYLGGHRMWLRFDDGLQGEVDLASALRGPVFEPLKDPAYFARFALDTTLVWPNGADLAPEFLHDEVARNQPRNRGRGIEFDPAGDVGTPSRESASSPDEISRFLGIVVRMPKPEGCTIAIVAESGADRIEIDVESERSHGSLPPRAQGHLDEWRRIHREELRANAERLARGEPLERIEPLE